MTTLDDAVEALAWLESAGHLELGAGMAQVLRTFFDRVQSLKKPAPAMGYAQCLDLGAALNAGFKPLDDDTSLLVVSTADLLAFLEARK